MCVSWLLQHLLSRKRACLAVKTAKSRVNYVESREQLPGCSLSCTVGQPAVHMSWSLLTFCLTNVEEHRESTLLVIWELCDHSSVFFTPFGVCMSLQSLWLHLITSLLHLSGVGLEHWSHHSLWRFVLQRELVNAPQCRREIKRRASRACTWMFRKSST